MRVGHPFARAELERLELARCKDLRELCGRQRAQPGAHGVVRRIRISHGGTVAGADAEEFSQVALRVRTAADAQEVDYLDEQPRGTATGTANGICQLTQAGNEPVVADAQQGTAGNFADAGGFHHDGAGASTGKAAVPFEYLGSDVTVGAGAPGNHGGHPGALWQGKPAHLHRREQARARSLFGRRPASGDGVVTNPFRRPPHGALLAQDRVGASTASVRCGTCIHQPACAGTTAVASISTFACCSMRATTCTTLMTGKCLPMTAR
jgi:hypothetical protein